MHILLMSPYYWIHMPKAIPRVFWMLLIIVQKPLICTSYLIYPITSLIFSGYCHCNKTTDWWVMVTCRQDDRKTCHKEHVVLIGHFCVMYVQLFTWVWNVIGIMSKLCILLFIFFFLHKLKAKKKRSYSFIPSIDTSVYWPVGMSSGCWRVSMSTVSV